MILLAIDPGSKKHGWACVRLEGLRVRRLAHGDVNNDWRSFDMLRNQMRALGHVVEAVAIETPEGYVHEAFRGPTLIATAHAAGGMAWLAQYWGLQVIELSAAKVRKALVGRSTSPKGKKGLMDQLITEAVNANVLGMPKTSNVHARDALALAIVAGWTLAQKKGRAA